jgi:Holliday junction resolvase RusA-like endonuclease
MRSWRKPEAHPGPFGIVEVLAKVPQEVIEERVEVLRPQDIVLDLPLPVSVNRTSGSRLGSKHHLVKEWRRQANAYLMLTRQGKLLKLIPGTVFIEIVWDIQDIADIDNRIKHLLDYLQDLGVMNNDNKVAGLYVIKGATIAGCRVRVQPWQLG